MSGVSAHTVGQLCKCELRKPIVTISFRSCLCMTRQGCLCISDAALYYM